MFQKILQWIRGVLNKMLGQTSVKQALNVDVAISPFMAVALQEWSLMYTNQGSWLSDEIKSLNLPAAIAGEIARAVDLIQDADELWSQLKTVDLGVGDYVADKQSNSILLSKDGGIGWYSIINLDEFFDDGGYGDLFYNPVTQEYVNISYHGTDSTADVKQYNFTVNW